MRALLLLAGVSAVCVVVNTLALETAMNIPILEVQATYQPTGITLLQVLTGGGVLGYAVLLLLIGIVALAGPSLGAARRASGGTQLPLICRAVLGLGTGALLLGVFASGWLWRTLVWETESHSLSGGFRMVARAFYPIMSGSLAAIVSLVVYGISVLLFNKRVSNAMPPAEAAGTSGCGGDPNGST